jgi:hypothetical protein
MCTHEILFRGKPLLNTSFKNVSRIVVATKDTIQTKLTNCETTYIIFWVVQRINPGMECQISTFYIHFNQHQFGCIEMHEDRVRDKSSEMFPSEDNVI